MKKLIYKLSALLVLITWTACTELQLDTPKKEVNTEDTDPNKRTVELSFQKELTVAGGANTRAIAINTETEIKSLDIYMFACAYEIGEYTFQKQYCYRSDASATIPDGAEAVKLITTSGKPSVILRPEKGTYVKLYCVANQTELFEWDDTTLKYKKYDTFTPFSQTAPGMEGNVITPGVPTEEKFKTLVTKVIYPDKPDKKEEGIRPALPMSGASTNVIDLMDFSAASRILTEIRMVRAVSRFDILNNPATTKFTLDSVAMLNARPTSKLFPIEAIKGGADQDKLIQYPTMPKLNGAEPTDKSYPIFYSYASTKEDYGEIILIGRYEVSKGRYEKVNYKIPFIQQKENGDAVYVEINPNHRYTIEIRDANQYEVKFNFVVNDWDEGEKFETYEPEQDVHIALAATGQPNALSYVQDSKRRIFMYMTGTPKVIVEMASNKDFEVLDDPITYTRATEKDWLKMEKEVTWKDNGDPSAIPPVTPPINGGTYPTHAKKIYKLTFTRANTNALPADYKLPIAKIKVKETATNNILEYEIVAIPNLKSGFSQICPIGDYFFTYYYINNNYTYAAQKTWNLSPWRMPTMNEIDEIFGMPKPYTDLTDEEQTSAIQNYLPATNLEAMQAIVRSGIHAKWFFTDTEKDATHHWISIINYGVGSSGGVLRTSTVYLNTNELKGALLMRYDANQPN